MSNYSDDPWELRNKYIEVIANRSEENVAAFLKVNFKQNLGELDKIKILKLLEMQYHAMLMYTSCGWFFDEVADLGTIQDISYATRALQLASSITGDDYTTPFKEKLSQAKSNEDEYESAGDIYDKLVKPAMLDLLRVGVHYAVSSLFTRYPRKSHIYCYLATSLHHEEFEAGRHRLAIGQAALKSEMTWETAEFTYAVLHLGDQQMFGGVRRLQNEAAYQSMREEIVESFERSNIHEIIYLQDKYFGAHNYSFWHLFRDDQRKILTAVLQKTLSSVDALFRRLYESNYPIMQALKQINMTLPSELKNIDNYVINTDLKAIFSSPIPDVEMLHRTIENSKRFQAELDTVTLDFSIAKSIAGLMYQLQKNPEDTELMNVIITVLEKIKELKLEPELWEARNIAFALRRKLFSHHHELSHQNDPHSRNWCNRFNALYESLNMKA